MFRKIGEYKADFGVNENGRVVVKNGAAAIFQNMDGCDPDADFEALIYGRQSITVTTDRLSKNPMEPTPIGPMEYEDAADELACAKAKKKAELAAARYAAEIAGVKSGKLTIRTDRESQALITGSALQVIDNPEYSCQWKTESGFVTLDAKTILDVARAVRAYVQACFDKEAAKGAEVDAAKTQAELDAITW